MKNIKIGPKLIVSFLFLAVLTAGMGFYLLNTLDHVVGDTDELYEKGIIPLGVYVNITDGMQVMRLQTREWRLAKTPEKRALALRKMQESATKLQTSLDELLEPKRIANRERQSRFTGGKNSHC